MATTQPPPLNRSRTTPGASFSDIVAATSPGLNRGRRGLRKEKRSISDWKAGVSAQAWPGIESRLEEGGFYAIEVPARSLSLRDRFRDAAYRYKQPQRPHSHGRREGKREVVIEQDEVAQVCEEEMERKRMLLGLGPEDPRSPAAFRHEPFVFPEVHTPAPTECTLPEDKLAAPADLPQLHTPPQTLYDPVPPKAAMPAPRKQHTRIPVRVHSPPNTPPMTPVDEDSDDSDDEDGGVAMGDEDLEPTAPSSPAMDAIDVEVHVLPPSPARSKPEQQEAIEVEVVFGDEEDFGESDDEFVPLPKLPPSDPIDLTGTILDPARRLSLAFDKSLAITIPLPISRSVTPRPSTSPLAPAQIALPISRVVTPRPPSPPVAPDQIPLPASPVPAPVNLPFPPDFTPTATPRTRSPAPPRAASPPPAPFPEDVIRDSAPPPAPLPEDIIEPRPKPQTAQSTPTVPTRPAAATTRTISAAAAPTLAPPAPTAHGLGLQLESVEENAPADSKPRRDAKTATKRPHHCLLSGHVFISYAQAAPATCSRCQEKKLKNAWQCVVADRCGIVVCGDCKDDMAQVIVTEEDKVVVREETEVVWGRWDKDEVVVMGRIPLRKRGPPQKSNVQRGKWKL